MNNLNPQHGVLLKKDDFVQVFDHLAESHGFLLAKVQIQNLPQINAQYGTDFGDVVIKTITEVLLASHRRYALGEISKALYAFICLHADDAYGLARHLEQELAVINHKGQFEFLIELSIGIVRVEPEREKNMQYWADLANLALVVSSRTGKAVVYTPELTIQTKLRDILARLRPESEPPEGMYWVFQKVNRTNTGKVTGYETLVRWDVPGLGLVSPAEFIPLAEDLDVIHYLDRWTLMEVAKHRKQLVGSNGYQVSINVSAKTLEFDVDYLLLLESVIQNATPDVPWLIVELTETAIVENREKLASKLQRLQSMGVQIAIDDFGSGETNLAQVGQTPCDYLKIDGSLVRMKDRVQASSLLEISMTMAKLLGATALLEGIETQADFQLASTLGIPLVQGWYFGQPLTVEELYKQSN